MDQAQITGLGPGLGGSLVNLKFPMGSCLRVCESSLTSQGEAGLWCPGVHAFLCPRPLREGRPQRPGTLGHTGRPAFRGLWAGALLSCPVQSWPSVLTQGCILILLCAALGGTQSAGQFPSLNPLEGTGNGSPFPTHENTRQSGNEQTARERKDE